LVIIAVYEHEHEHDDMTVGDDQLLAKLGYKQEFKRHFTFFEVFGLGFSIIGLIPSIASVLINVLPSGGAIALVWGWAVCAFFLTFIALAMADLGSAMPTSGGVYYWTYKYSSDKWRTLLCWIVGYTNMVTSVAALASMDWGCAVQICAAVSIGTHMRFIPTTSQTYGVFAAIVISHGLFCSMGTKVIARLQRFWALLNIVLILAMFIGLPIATPKEFKNTAKYAFGDFENFNGWPSGYAFVLSFLGPLWVIGAFDSTLHISEEATNANIAVPWAMISACGVASVLGWGVNVALAFNMGTDIKAILTSPIQQPLAAIFLNSFGPRCTLTVWSLTVVAQYMMGASYLTSSSRQTFAFARDGALPFSRFIYSVNKYTLSPVVAVWCTAFLALLLALLAFAGTAAISAVFTLSVIGQYVAYSIPITARFVGGQPFTPGPVNLGKFSLPIAIVAVTWMTFMSIVFLFPTSPNPQAPVMNYSVVVLGGVLILSVIYFYFPKYGGVYWFKGPVTTVEDMVERDRDSHGSVEKPPVSIQESTGYI